MSLFLFCNDPPQLNGIVNRALVRRIIVINCTSTFVENDDEVDEEQHFYRADKRFEKKDFLLTLIPALLKKIMEAYK